MLRRARWSAILVIAALARPASAQVVNAARLAILQAEDRRAATAADLATIRAGVASGDPVTARVAVRALGRLERPALVPDIVPALGRPYPDLRAEAANAVAQAMSGLRRGATGGPAPASVLRTLTARLTTEDDAGVRAALAEAVGRLPYADADSVAAAEEVLLAYATAHADVPDRLGVAKAFEALARSRRDAALSRAAIDVIRGLAAARPTSVPLSAAETPGGRLSARAGASAADPARDARVRRLAWEALITTDGADAALIAVAATDVDPQVRRLAVRAAARAQVSEALAHGLADPSPVVRWEAVRGYAGATGGASCATLTVATADADAHVGLQAIDGLLSCRGSAMAVERLTELAGDSDGLLSPRGWHQASHALVALAAAWPDHAVSLLDRHVASKNPFVRVYAARAAAVLKRVETLTRLAGDPDDNVAEAAIDGLAANFHPGGAAPPGRTPLVDESGATAAYVAALRRRGYQAVRAAARALAVSHPDPSFVAPLTAALDRLTAEGHANSTDARRAIASALTALGAPPRSPIAPAPIVSDLTLAELRRLAAPRARFTIRGVGVMDVALITAEAPATVLRVAQLAERGYYNGLTIHRVAPNFVLQGGSPDANEYVGHPDYMRDEVGAWPHVRGALGISTRGRDTGDAQFFLDLVDNPRLDHEFTVFGQVIAGLDAADRVLEGDVIESVQILDGH